MDFFKILFFLVRKNESNYVIVEFILFFVSFLKNCLDVKKCCFIIEENRYDKSAMESSKYRWKRVYIRNSTKRKKKKKIDLFSQGEESVVTNRWTIIYLRCKIIVHNTVLYKNNILYKNIYIYIYAYIYEQLERRRIICYTN